MRWVLVDIETTGLNILHDKITEIAVKVVTENGVESTWNSLINPNRSIPQVISQLTGITNDMVQEAPLFAEIADELMGILDDGILVAHNARFDYGFLRNAFKDSGYSLRVSVLCTIKLFKKLYPGLAKYNLRYLADHFNIITPTHRAAADVDTLHALLQCAYQAFSTENVIAAAKLCYQQASLPSKLVTDIKSIPDSPGVYFFYGEDAHIPLYIGKSVTLRQRILSHFQSDHSHAKEFTMAQQVVRVEFIPTAGELSALLLESQLIKEKMPLYNRRLRRQKNIVGYKLIEKSNYLTVEIIKEASAEQVSAELYGSFRSLTSAKENLRLIAKDFQLCPKLCGLESSKHACFSHQLKKCHGACIGKESFQDYNARVQKALGEFKQAIWPFNGNIAIKEHCPKNQLTQFMVFNQWRHLGTVECMKDIANMPADVKPYDVEDYKILYSQLTKLDKDQIILVE